MRQTQFGLKKQERIQRSHLPLQMRPLRQNQPSVTPPPRNAQLSWPQLPTMLTLGLVITSLQSPPPSPWVKPSGQIYTWLFFFFLLSFLS